MQQHAQRVAKATGAEVLLDERLAPHLSMRVGGPVPAFVAPTDPEGVARVVRDLVAAGAPVRLLGGGSNLVAEDDGLAFVVVHVGAATPAPRWDGATVRVAAGVALATVVREAAAQGMSGLEWAAGLPGTVGGAVVGNAGAFGGEIGKAVRAVSVMRPDGTVRRHVVRDGDFAYRTSFLSPEETVLEVELQLQPSTPDAVRKEADRVNRQRAGSQPKGGHSSGCMFKNPAHAPAGLLIERCGLKGRRRGGARVSEAHANFVINDGTATAADILGLIDEIRAEVRQQVGVDLELEIKVWRGERGGCAC
jgi:UDP-N-acetylmuramate dehydrogenase